MVDVRITLSGLWIATMLTYLLGDVLRIFSGDFVAGEVAGQEVGSWMYLLMAVIMVIPIVMVVLSLTVPFPAIRWIVLVVAVLLIVFNLVGLPYEGAYDNFLIVVSIVFKAVIIWYAWNWQVSG